MSGVIARLILVSMCTSACAAYRQVESPVAPHLEPRSLEVRARFCEERYRAETHRLDQKHAFGQFLVGFGVVAGTTGLSTLAARWPTHDLEKDETLGAISVATLIPATVALVTGIVLMTRDEVAEGPAYYTAELVALGDEALPEDAGERATEVTVRQDAGASAFRSCLEGAAPDEAKIQAAKATATKTAEAQAVTAKAQANPPPANPPPPAPPANPPPANPPPPAPPPRTP